MFKLTRRGFLGATPALAAGPKTYVHPLYLPDGRPVCVDGPADHVHLRGLMVAGSGVNGVDFWGK